MPKMSLDTWLGFSDELQKIAAPTSLGDVRKAVTVAGTSLSNKKMNYSKPNKDITPASSTDLSISPKTVQPPPVS